MKNKIIKSMFTYVATASNLRTDHNTWVVQEAPADTTSVWLETIETDVWNNIILELWSFNTSAPK